MSRTYTFSEYISRIKVATSRKKKYYERGKLKKPIPAKFSNDNYIYVNYPYRSKAGRKDKWLLTDKRTGEKVISNPRTAGTPKYIPINTQYFYEGFRDEHTRMSIVNGIKDYYMSNLPNGIEKIEKFPIELEFVFRTTVTKDFDLDNHSWVYIKVFNDLLKKLGAVPDDNVRYINKYSARLEPIDNFDERQLIVIIYD